MNSNWSYSLETQLGSKLTIFLSRVTLVFEGWPWKTTGHLFYTMSRFVHSFKVMAEFKLEFQSGNSQFRSKSVILVLCDLEIWQMTLKNNRAPLLCYVKLGALFQSYWWNQTWVTVRKRSIWIKIDDFLSPVTLKFDRWPWKTIGYLFYAASSFVHHFIAISELKLELWSGNPILWPNRIFCPVWPWNLTDDHEKQ